jgi:hypothetical protein
MFRFTPRPLYPRGKYTHYQVDRRLGGTQSRSRHRREEKDLCSSRDIKHRFSGHPAPGIVTSFAEIRREYLKSGYRNSKSLQKKSWTMKLWKLCVCSKTRISVPCVQSQNYIGLPYPLIRYPRFQLSAVCRGPPPKNCKIK